MFQDDVFVSGLQDGSTQPVVVIMLGSLGRRRKRQRADWGTYGLPFLAPNTLPRLAKVHSVPEFQECAFEHYQKARGAAWMGVDRCQQTYVQNTAQDYFYQESERHVS